MLALLGEYIPSHDIVGLEIGAILARGGGDSPLIVGVLGSELVREREVNQRLRAVEEGERHQGHVARPRPNAMIRVGRIETAANDTVSAVNREGIGERGTDISGARIGDGRPVVGEMRLLVRVVRTSGRVVIDQPHEGRAILPRQEHR